MSTLKQVNRMAEHLATAEFDESKVERDENGRFAPSGGGSSKEGNRDQRISNLDKKFKDVGSTPGASVRALDHMAEKARARGDHMKAEEYKRQADQILDKADRDKAGEGEVTVYKKGAVSNHGMFSYKVEPDVMKQGDKFFIRHKNGPLVIHEGPKAETPEKAEKLSKEAMRRTNPGLFRNTYMSSQGEVGYVLPDKDGGLRGSLPTSITENPAFKNYHEGFGYKYHEARTHEGDRVVTKETANRGWTDEKTAHFLISQSGRHAGDALTFEGDEGMGRLRSVMKSFEKKYDPEAYKD